jgi:hypothetical protein
MANTNSGKEADALTRSAISYQPAGTGWLVITIVKVEQACQQ